MPVTGVAARRLPEVNFLKVMQQKSGSTGIWGVSVSHELVWLEALVPYAYTVCVTTALGTIVALSHRTVIYSRDVKRWKIYLHDTLGAFLLLWIIEVHEFQVYSSLQGLNTLARGMWLHKGLSCSIHVPVHWGVCAYHEPIHSQKLRQVPACRRLISESSKSKM